MVVTPCVVALFTGVENSDDSSESDVLRDGFV
jgi:hypothetical protein